jgi:hypothetical protein
MKPEMEQLLRELGQVSGINCVIQNEGATSELFFNHPEQMKVGFLDGWGTYESPDFHIHFRCNDLDTVRFIDGPGECIERSTYLMIYDNAGVERLRFYFPNSTDTSRPYSDEELALFDRFKERYGHFW